MEVVDTGSNIIQRVWAPVDDVDIYRVGALVGWETGDTDGVIMAGVAGAGPDATTNICGIIEAVDERDPTFNPSFGGNQVTGVITKTAQDARNLGYSSDRGVIPHNDAGAFVKIALLTPWTKVKIPIFNANFGVGITEFTVTTGDTSGLGFSSNSVDFTPVAGEATSFFRTGPSEGLQRISNDTDAAVETNDQAFKVIAIGDVGVRVPYRRFGESKVVTDAEGIFADGASTGASNHWRFHVLYLDLERSGEEAMYGFFNHIHFDSVANTS